MPLDPQSQAVLGILDQSRIWDFGDATPAAVRARMVAGPLPAGPEVHVRQGRVAGGEAEIDARFYRPSGAQGLLPTLIYVHGGGFVLGNLDGHDNVCRQLCADSGCGVISLDYRLAPEAKFPAAPEDCYAATRFIHEHAAELGVDATRLAIGGDSAGGNLAAVTTQLVRDRGGATLVFQLLLYPVTDFREFDTPSHRDNARGYFLTRDAMEWFREHYLRDLADRSHPMASPSLASDLRGLPSAFVVTAEYDPLRDEGEAYARALETAHVPVRLRRFAGTIHGFVSFYAFIDAGREALTHSAAALREALIASAPGRATRA